MAISRVKVWIAGEVLTASDLNGEFNNIIDNLGLTGFIADGSLTSPGLQFYNDANTGIYRQAADQLGIVAGGVEVFRASPYASAVNFLLGVPGQAGTGAVLAASGSDTNVALLLRGKGTGYVQASRFVFESFAATQSSVQAGRAYWQVTEGCLHIDAGTIIARVPAVQGLQAGDLIEAQNPTGVSGATIYARVQRPPLRLSRLIFETSTKLSLASGYIPLKVGGAWVRRTLHNNIELIAPAVVSNTLYYIYATDSAGTTTLEASTTGHATATQGGVEVKSGDETRTLVGAAFAGTAGAFSDAAQTRLTASWFDRRPTTAQVTIASTYAASNTTYQELDSTKRASFFTWGETVNVAAGGGDIQNNSAAGGFVFVGIGADSSLVTCDGAGGGQSPAAGNRFFYHAHTATSFAEGTHFVSMVWRVNTGQGQLTSSSNPERAVLRAQVTI